jgi:hypothetical protein
MNKPKKSIPIRLDQADFQCLVRGGVLEIKVGEGEIRIMLADIGFDIMYDCIERVENGEEEVYKNLTRDL